MACSAKRRQHGTCPGRERPDPQSVYEPITDRRSRAEGGGVKTSGSIADSATPFSASSLIRHQAFLDTRRAPGALIVLADAMFFGQTPRLVAFTATARLPALFPEKQVAQAGGLMAYGPSIPAALQRAVAFVDKILRGANPADLPVEAPTTFEFVINLKTAKALGLTVPDKLLATADEVIE